jgi:hypothetical protein
LLPEAALFAIASGSRPVRAVLGDDAGAVRILRAGVCGDAGACAFGGERAARGVLSKALQALKLSVSLQSVRRPFWQARYYDFNVFTHRKLVEKLRYMHRNPVKRGLAMKSED